MSGDLTSVLRSELGLDALAEQNERIIELLERLPQNRQFYTLDETSRLLRVATPIVRKMIADGRLWKLEGLDTSSIRIPAAAIEALQQRNAPNNVVQLPDPGGSTAA